MNCAARSYVVSETQDRRARLDNPSRIPAFATAADQATFNSCLLLSAPLLSMLHFVGDDLYADMYLIGTDLHSSLDPRLRPHDDLPRYHAGFRPRL